MENKELKIIELKARLYDLRQEGERIQQEYNLTLKELQDLSRE